MDRKNQNKFGHISERVKSRLADLKDNVKTSHDYFAENAKRFYSMMDTVFHTSLDQTARNNLNTINKPVIEFNVIESFISRLRGEFADQEPGIRIQAADGVPAERLEEVTQTIKVLEAHFKEIFSPEHATSLPYRLFTDMLGGGYSVAHVYTDYLSPMRFEQGIFVERVFDPTMCGFDPLARLPHKGDGKYCFQLFPVTKDEMKERYGEEVSNAITFNASADLESFNWSYTNAAGEEIALVCSYYEKRRTRKKIFLLADKTVVTEKEYEKILERYSSPEIMAVPPAIIDMRETYIEVIDRYDFCESHMLAHVKTDYKYLPLVFFDGNSVLLRMNGSGASKQMTKPYGYNVIGTQKLKNVAGQALAAELQNMMQHKIIIAEESLPQDENWLKVYKNPQVEGVLVYDCIDEETGQQLPPPSVIPRPDIPPTLLQTFQMCDQTLQAILGSYDAIIGSNKQDTSGVAIDKGAIQSNAASKPYLIGYIDGLNRVAQIIVDLIPKYYVTPRTIPIKNEEGRREYQLINDPRNQNSVAMDYNPDDLKVVVEAGANSAVQRRVALEQITSLASMNPTFADFINAEGLSVIVDNLDIRGADELRKKAAEYMQKVQQQQAMEMQLKQQELAKLQADTEAQQQAQDSITQEAVHNEFMVRSAEIQQKREKAQAEEAIEVARLQMQNREMEIKYMEALAKIQSMQDKTMIDRQKAQAEEVRASLNDLKPIIENMVKEHEPERLEEKLEV